MYNSLKIEAVKLLGLVVRPRSIYWRGSSSPLLFYGGSHMKELSVFIDESGDFGEYDDQSPYYIITMVFHDQSIVIEDAINKLDQELSYMNLNEMCIHTGPIIRKEEVYEYMSIKERRHIFNKLVAFFRQVDIRYKCISIKKRKNDDVIQTIAQLSRKMSQFIKDNIESFLSCGVVKIYYDNGQIEVSRMLALVFSVLTPNSEFRRVMPKDYKLFQVADLICSMELVRLKMEDDRLSHSEELFFGSRYDLKRNYLRIIQRKEWK